MPKVVLKPHVNSMVKRGNEGHVIIQSFKPGEVTPEQCNQLGLALAEKFAPNHQVVSTHTTIRIMYTIIL